MKNNDKKQSVEEKDCTNCTDEYHCDWLAAVMEHFWKLASGYRLYVEE